MTATPPPGQAYRRRLAKHINRRYDSKMFDPLLVELYGKSDFHNLGYWTEETKSQAEACDNLTRQVIELIPDKSGTILDVACGKGATTLVLLDWYAPSDVTGINISVKQLDRCKKNAPGCTFSAMDAVDLEFPDNHFDNLISLEAAFHFVTREAFLREAYRVLKPGGVLAISDVLAHNPAEKKLTCAENYIANIDDYREVWVRAGFSNNEVRDETDRCRNGFYRNLAEFAKEKLQAKEIDLPRFLRLQAISRHMIQAGGYYVLARGQKAIG